MKYVGRFAPSPTGPLHLGSLVSALASWLDARAHQGSWLVRIEDIDSTRCQPQWSELILKQLQACELYSDGPIVYQSKREHLYLRYLEELMPTKLLYPCRCSRLQIEQAQTRTRQTLIYPGTCRRHEPVQRSDYRGFNQNASSTDLSFPTPIARSGFFEFFCDTSIRIEVPNQTIHWFDRRLGEQQQNPSLDVGDFVRKSRDNHFSYQWAVVVDDIDQGVSDIVRGEDLADNTPRQLLLYDLLKRAKPQYFHVPLVTTTIGEKLSKQTNAPALDPSCASEDLNKAALHLGLTPMSAPLTERLQSWVQQWSDQCMGLSHRATKMG